MAEHVAWLIALGSNPPQWWTGRGPNQWTTMIDGSARFPADFAIRFARREDADRAIGWLVKEGVRDGCKAEEHLWLDAAVPVASTPQAEFKEGGLCQCGARIKHAPGIGPYCTRTGYDGSCGAPVVAKIRRKKSTLGPNDSRNSWQRLFQEVPPVDRSKTCTTTGEPVEKVRAEQTEATGQHKGYIVLCADERARGFVRPLRNSYRHQACGSITTMGEALSETYARDPSFYGATFCVRCNAHYPVSEFVWTADGQQVGS